MIFKQSFYELGKSIIKKLILVIGFFIICYFASFCFSLKNVLAYTYIGEDSSIGFNQYEVHGTCDNTSNYDCYIGFDFTTPTTFDTDYVAFKFNTFMIEQFDSSGNYSSGYYGLPKPDGSVTGCWYDSNNMLVCPFHMSVPDDITYEMSFNGLLEGVDLNATICWFDNNYDHLMVCPVIKNKLYKTFIFNMRGRGTQGLNPVLFKYELALDRKKIKFNNDNTSVIDTIKDDDTTGANNQGKSFFDNFDTGIDSGLTSVISKPLTTIQGAFTGSCTPIHLTIPFTNQEFDLPCLTPIYEEHFGYFFTIYQTIISGIICYWVIVNIFRVIKNMVDPDDDKVEVVDL